MSYYPDNFPARGIVADTGWIDRRGEYGHRRVLYAVDRVTDDVLFRARERGDRHVKRWVLQTQSQTRCGDGTLRDPGPWEAWGYGDTPEAAVAECIADTQYQRAESLHEWHRDAVAALNRARANANRRAAIRAEILGLGLMPDSAGRTGLRNDAELRYRSALKRARLYNAAMKNNAPEEKLRPIRDEVKAWLAAETAARTARLRDLEAELATLS